MITIIKLASGSFVPDTDRNKIYLSMDNWDDYSYKTLFYLTVFDHEGKKIEVGNLKIGYKDQDEGSTGKVLPERFTKLGLGYFSLGQSSEYYKIIESKLSKELGDFVLGSLCDITYNDDCYKLAENETVFEKSLLRSVSITAIKDQFKRILNGLSELTEYHFSYKKLKSEKSSNIELDFHVIPNSKPSTNMNVIIGRNGVGKTTLLNGIIDAIIDKDKPNVGNVYNELMQPFFKLGNNNINSDYFSSVVSIAFSAFEPFAPPKEQSDKSKGTCFFYVGLKKPESTTLKDHSLLNKEFVNSLFICFSLVDKKNKWISAISKLESDSNFREMNLRSLANISDDGICKKRAESLFKRMSSGHAIVLLSITKLVEHLEEKTLILVDEPESHLHPPLLSAFLRSLSKLLISRNAVAIIATHSPVVLQEVPSSCVWKLFRTHEEVKVEKPRIETFGENVGVLTREIFGLEVAKSGFHELLEKSVYDGGSYDSIMNAYNHQLGFEGKAILRALISNRDNQR